MLSQAASDVGFVVLDGDLSRNGHGLGKLGGLIMGMQVVGYRPGLEGEEIAEVLDGLLEELVGLGVVHVAKMLAEQGLVGLEKTDGVLHLPANGEDGGKLTRQIYELGCIAARSAEQLGLAVDYSGDRVVAAITDRPIVGEKVIGDGGELGEGLVVVGNDGFLGDVAAGHYQGRRIEQE
ncbi:hypothetical protein ES705_24330 [subsurface metagenome]